MFEHTVLSFMNRSCRSDPQGIDEIREGMIFNSVFQLAASYYSYRKAVLDEREILIWVRNQGDFELLRGVGMNGDGIQICQSRDWYAMPLIEIPGWHEPGWVIARLNQESVVNAGLCEFLTDGLADDCGDHEWRQKGK